MRTIRYLVLLAAASAAWAQEDAPKPGVKTEAVEQKDPEEGALVKAAELRSRVRGMRKTVLGGGPAVEKAEKEALNFYRRKLQSNASRVDELRTRRDVKEAEYKITLDATLSAEDEEARDKAARTAASLRAGMAAIDSEMEELRRQRASLGNAISAIQARIDRRKRIIEHFDQGEMEEALPFLGEDVLGPDDNTAGGGDPLADDGLFRDLLRRDPARARAILFARDPARYWKMFPLTPPESALRRALAFPAADMPGRR